MSFDVTVYIWCHWVGITGDIKMQFICNFQIGVEQPISIIQNNVGHPEELWMSVENIAQVGWVTESII